MKDRACAYVEREKKKTSHHPTVKWLWYVTGNKTGSKRTLLLHPHLLQRLDRLRGEYCDSACGIAPTHTRSGLGTERKAN